MKNKISKKKKKKPKSINKIIKGYKKKMHVRSWFSFLQENKKNFRKRMTNIYKGLKCIHKNSQPPSKCCFRKIIVWKKKVLVLSSIWIFNFRFVSDNKNRGLND
jgi:hypothetical protein